MLHSFKANIQTVNGLKCALLEGKAMASVAFNQPADSLSHGKVKSSQVSGGYRNMVNQPFLYTFDVYYEDGLRDPSEKSEKEWPAELV